MPMTVIVTRDAPSRIRGFLASVALEIAPGVYTAPRMTRAVRERVWMVLEAWHGAYGDGEAGAVVMTWQDPKQSGGQGVLTLGEPPKLIVDADGVLLVRRSGVA